MPDDDTLTVPIPGQGEDEMSTDGSMGISDDCLELSLDSQVGTHEQMMAEIGANAETAHSIVRVSGARKFNREDPIEAAAAETILKIKPV